MHQVFASMEDDEVYTESGYIYKDVAPELEAIISNQQKELEHLEQQTAVLQEQINGLSLIANLQYATIGLFVLVAVVLLGWHILNKWFFRGV